MLAHHFLFMHINTLANSVCRRIQMLAAPPPTGDEQVRHVTISYSAVHCPRSTAWIEGKVSPRRSLPERVSRRGHPASAPSYWPHGHPAAGQPQRAPTGRCASRQLAVINLRTTHKYRYIFMEKLPSKTSSRLPAAGAAAAPGLARTD